MPAGITLEQYMVNWAGEDERRIAIATTLRTLSGACRTLSEIIGAGALAGALGEAHAKPRGPVRLDGRNAASGEGQHLGGAVDLTSGTSFASDSSHGLASDDTHAVDGAATRVAAGDHFDGEVQKALDVIANELLITSLAAAPVAAMVSEELDHVVELNPGAPLLVAVDPLDGSSNIDTNVSVGTIFSVQPAPLDGSPADIPAFLQPGVRQLAAGYALYGPHTAFVVTVGSGTHVFTLDRTSGDFKLTAENVRVPPKTREFAINASNHRHWDEPIRIYVDDCLKGAEGPRGEDFNMRWIASMVAEAHRVLTRGGIYMYPSDLRDGYQRGRLRLIYEANPIAWLIEQAGGGASTGIERILEIVPEAIHQRVPLIFGSRDEVARLDRYHLDPYPIGERSPLFGRRGLFRS
jgi:fructose-1,6-bisphosphatase I